MGRGAGRRPGRKDFTLLRDDANPDDIFDAEQAATRRKVGTLRGMGRLLALAKDEAWVRHLLTVHCIHAARLAAHVAL